MKSRPIKSFSFKDFENKKKLAERVQEMYNSYSWAKKRKDHRFNSEKVHVSSMIQENYCALKQLYSRELDILPTMESTDLGLQYIWGIGKSLEDVNQKATIERLGNSNIIGSFSCTCGKTTYLGRMLSSKDTPICKYCDTEVNQYKELKLELGVLTGSPDMLACYDSQKFTITEYKSVKRETFLGMTRPENLHMQQAWSYLEMFKILIANNSDILDHLGLDLHELNLESVLIVYTCKDYLGIHKSPIKVFEVTYDQFNLDVIKKLTSTLHKYANMNYLGDEIKRGGLCEDFKTPKQVHDGQSCEFYEYCKARKLQE